MVKLMLDEAVLNNVKWEKACDPKNMRSVKKASVDFNLLI